MPAEQSSTPVRWIADSPDNLLWARVGEDYVAYHRPSGTTHLLNDASHRLLCEILTRPRDFPSIVREAVEVPDGEAAERYAAEMRDLLDHLERLGMVERA